MLSASTFELLTAAHNASLSLAGAFCLLHQSCLHSVMHRAQRALAEPVLPTQPRNRLLDVVGVQRRAVAALTERRRFAVNLEVTLDKRVDRFRLLRLAFRLPAVEYVCHSNVPPVRFKRAVLA